MLANKSVLAKTGRGGDGGVVNREAGGWRKGESKKGTGTSRTRSQSPFAVCSGSAALEREIDQRVYALYGLTPDEVKIVEDSTR